MDNTRPDAATGWRGRLQHVAVVAAARSGLKIGLLAAPHGYLRESGWMTSARKGRPVDRAGRPQPWLTMPATRLLADRLSRDHLLFEYGAGGSTAWFASHVGRVISVEHHRGWYEEVLATLPAHVELHLRETAQPGAFLDLVFRPLGQPTDYSLAVAELPDRAPDVVVIDGVDRLNCIAAAMRHVADAGVLLVDNLEYDRPLAPAIELLTAAGFRLLPLWGVAPGELRQSCTGIFYRDGNCLGI